VGLLVSERPVGYDADGAAADGRGRRDGARGRPTR